MAVVSYARVSSVGQSLDVQLDTLRHFDKIFKEKRSGVSNTRPRLKACIEYVRDGDTLVVTRLDRLARSMLHLCQLAEKLETKGVKHSSQNSNEGSTPALSNKQAMKLLNAPDVSTLKGQRDQAILATLLYHGLRRDEVCKLRVKDYHLRQGVWHFRVEGKRSKIRYLPVAPVCQQAISDYLEFSGHGEDWEGALFRPIKIM